MRWVASIALLLLVVLACTHEPPTSPPATAGPAAASPQNEPTPPASHEAAPTDATRSATTTTSADPESPIGIASCDEYLSLYRACEPTLQPEIAAGNRRPFRGERGRLQHLAGTPERAGLADSCTQMLAELRTACPKR